MEISHREKNICEVEKVCSECNKRFMVNSSNLSVTTCQHFGKIYHNCYVYKCPNCGETVTTTGHELPLLLKNEVLKKQKAHR